MNKKFLSTALALAMLLGSYQAVYATEAKEMPTTEKKIEAVEEKAEEKAKEVKEEAKKEETKAEEKAEEVKEEAKKEEKAEEAKEITAEDLKVKYLIDNKIVIGRTEGDASKVDMALDATIQRAEITKLLVHIIGKTEDAAKVQAEKGMFADVPETYWANGVINVASKEKSPVNEVAFIKGYEDGTFKGYKPVRYDELAKMLVVITKTDLTNELADKQEASWPGEWIKWAEEMGLFDGVAEKDFTKDATRKDAFVMIYNALDKMGKIELKEEPKKEEVKTEEKAKDEVKKEETKVEEKN